MPKCDFNKAAKHFIEITLSHGCSPVNLQHIFRALFRRNTFGWLLLFLLCYGFFAAITKNLKSAI